MTDHAPDLIEHTATVQAACSCGWRGQHRSLQRQGPIVVLTAGDLAGFDYLAHSADPESTT
jgi:hypothetical protein